MNFKTDPEEPSLGGVVNGTEGIGVSNFVSGMATIASPDLGW